MKNKILFIILIFGIIGGCQFSNKIDSDMVEIFNNSLESEFKDLGNSLIKKRNPIEFESGVSVSDCARYLLELKKSPLSEGVNNQIIHNEYLSCEVLSLLKSHSLNKIKPQDDFGEKIAGRLDLGSYPSSLYRMARNQNKTLADFEQKYLKTNKNSVVYETDDWIYSLELVASTDFNNDGINDWVLWLHDQAKGGNYHTYTTLIVLNNRNEGLLKAIPYFKWMD